MKAYVTTLGRSAWGMVNSYHAMLKSEDFQPDVVHIVTEDVYEHLLGKGVEALKIISENFGFKPEFSTMVVKQADFVEAGTKVNGLIKDLKKGGYQIAVDITAGRKSLVAGTLIPLSKMDVDHVFYLAISTIKDVNKPYPMIPRTMQSLKDFIKQKEEARGSE
ncbi:MAG: hypothetical protein ACFFCS_20300 [Candidatus Hodarchaeota archaeon]